MFFRIRRRSDRELEEEIRYHLDTEIEERIRSGMAPHEAELAARREFGNVCQVQEVTRQMWGWNFFQRIWQDARYAARTLARTPVFAVTAVLSLGLGIGANIASFSLADAFLFRPLPEERPSEVVAINCRTSQESLQGVSYPDLRDLREKSRSFTDVIGYKLTRFAFARVPDAVPQMRMGMEVSQDFFAVLGLRPPVGRTFAHDECAVPGWDPVPSWATTSGRNSSAATHPRSARLSG